MATDSRLPMLAAEELIAAFAAHLPDSRSAAKRFGSASLGCLASAMVHWNAWVHFREDSACVRVNLEGMKYDGWPIARFIKAELKRQRPFEVIRVLSEPAQVKLMVHRDAWQFASRPQINERHIGLSEQFLPQIDTDGWRRTLLGAYDCLDAERAHRFRAKQIVTVKRGRVEMDVSPHLQFRQRISSYPAAVRNLQPRLATATEAFRPLHDYVTEQSAGSALTTGRWASKSHRKVTVKKRAINRNAQSWTSRSHQKH